MAIYQKGQTGNWYRKWVIDWWCYVLSNSYTLHDLILAYLWKSILYCPDREMNSEEVALSRQMRPHQQWRLIWVLSLWALAPRLHFPSADGRKGLREPELSDMGDWVSCLHCLGLQSGSDRHLVKNWKRSLRSRQKLIHCGSIYGGGFHASRINHLGWLQRWRGKRANWVT